MNFSDAIQAHTDWKLRLDGYALGASAEKIDAGTLRQDNVCELGRWLYGEGKQYSSDPKFGELLGLHADFHRCAASMAEMVQRGEGPEAAALINSRESDFGKLSLRVVGILMGFRSKYRE